MNGVRCYSDLARKRKEGESQEDNGYIAGETFKVGRSGMDSLQRLAREVALETLHEEHDALEGSWPSATRP